MVVDSASYALDGNGKVMLLSTPDLYVLQTPINCCNDCLTPVSFSISRLQHKMDAKAQSFLFAQETSDSCARCCFGAGRPLTIDIWQGQVEGSGPQLSSYVRPWRCGPGSCCCEQEISSFDHSSGTRQPAGMSKLPFACVTQKIDVYDSANALKYQIRGPGCCQCTPIGQVPFTIHGPEPETDTPPIILGTINKEWGGFKKECCTTADEFAVTFPLAADQSDRINLLGATFLIDFNFFGVSSQNGSSGEVDCECDDCECDC
jgi:hypothetical protein